MPTSDARYAAGDVIVVPFPYSDRLAEKRRPALVVSSPRLAAMGFIWVVMITSAKHSALADDLPILDLAGAGLGAPSIVRPVKIAHIEPDRIVRRAGGLGATQTAAVLAKVRAFVADRADAAARR